MLLPAQRFSWCTLQLRRRQWHPTPVLLPGKSHGWRSLVHSMGSLRVGHDWRDLAAAAALDLNILEKTLESPLDCKEIESVHPKGDQSWVFIGRTAVEAETPIFWPLDAKSCLIWKDPDAGRDWRQEKGTTEGEMAGWHHRLNGHEFG